MYGKFIIFLKLKLTIRVYIISKDEDCALRSRTLLVFTDLKILQCLIKGNCVGLDWDLGLKICVLFGGRYLLLEWFFDGFRVWARHSIQC